MDSKRLLALDGLRGVAILLVLTFHYFSRFPKFYPYGTTFSDLGTYGFLGVELFFIISGFVIAMTLRRSDGILEFAARRFARLWPPMLVCSLLTFVFLHVVDSPFTEFRRVGPQGFLPSLTFIAPVIWSRMVEGANWIDGSYWSLFVEVRFYFWAALIYFIAPRHLSAVLFVSTLLLVGLSHTATHGLHMIAPLFLTRFAAYFAAGAIFYDLWRGNTRMWHWPAIAILIAHCLSDEYAANHSLVSLTILAMSFVAFVLVCRLPNLLRPLECKPLVWLGRRSYSLYLLHQNIGVTLITLTATGLSVTTYALTILAVTTLMVLLAHLVYERVERKSHSIANIILDVRAVRKSRQT